MVEEQESLAKVLLEEYDCVAVFLEPELLSKFYHGFCRSSLRRCGAACTTWSASSPRSTW